MKGSCLHPGLLFIVDELWECGVEAQLMKNFSLTSGPCLIAMVRLGWLLEGALLHLPLSTYSSIFSYLPVMK